MEISSKGLEVIRSLREGLIGEGVLASPAWEVVALGTRLGIVRSSMASIDSAMIRTLWPIS